jgi:hypothetical protein
VILLYEVSSSGQLAALAEKLRALVAASRLDLTGNSLFATISLGATLLRCGSWMGWCRGQTA